MKSRLAQHKMKINLLTAFYHSCDFDSAFLLDERYEMVKLSVKSTL